MLRLFDFVVVFELLLIMFRLSLLITISFIIISTAHEDKENFNSTESYLTSL